MSREQYEVTWKDYYEILGVQPNASQRTIRRVWHRLSQIYHPDVAGDGEVDQHRMQDLNEAYEVLSNLQRRAKYDEAYLNRGHDKSSVSADEAKAPAPESSPSPVHGEPPEAPVTPKPAPPRRGKALALAGTAGVAVLVGVGLLPALLGNQPGPATPVPSAYRPTAQAPLPSSTSAATPAPAPTAGPDPAGTLAAPALAEPEILTPEPTPLPTVAATLASTATPRASVPLASLESKGLGFEEFQVSGNSWLVDFSSQCKDAPCLRSGAINGGGFSTLWLPKYYLPSTVKYISFDVKASSEACCGTFRIMASPRPVETKLPNATTWTRIELPVPEVRPVAFEWQFYSGPVLLNGQDGMWIDNIQFR
ncbi:MAG: hypothetical protein FJ316_01200 [SAR202 cluster bacterium]|nr:hypothetical protein [SAR202 cluster bacterium]